MFLCWSRFAAVAAFVAMQAGVAPSLASEEGRTGGDPFFDGFRQGMRLSGLWGGKSEGSLGSLLGFWDPLMQLASGFGATVKVFMDETVPQSCQLVVEAPETVQSSDLRFSLDLQRRSVTVSFAKEEKREQHDEQIGDSFSSKSFRGTSTIMLPDRCIATAAVFMAHLGGVVLAKERKNRRIAAVVLPSKTLIEEHVGNGALPDSIVSTIETGAEMAPKELTDLQQCLAAGFTRTQCQNLGDKKPMYESVPGSGTSSGLPIPVYNASLEMLD